MSGTMPEMADVSGCTDTPEYERLALSLILAIHRRQKQELGRTIEEINKFGWHRGVLHAINYAFVTVLNVIHVGGIHAEFSSEFVSSTQQAASNRHDGWLLVPDNCFAAAVSRAISGPTHDAGTPITVQAIRQAMLIETLAVAVSDANEDDFNMVVEASLANATAVIEDFLKTGELWFEN